VGLADIKTKHQLHACLRRCTQFDLEIRGQLLEFSLLANSRKWFVGAVIDESHIAAGRSVPDELNIVLGEAVIEVG
jgi:hypothetical protein